MFDLDTGIYKPITKPNHKPPRNVTTNIAEGVNQRLSANSSTEDMFNHKAPIYREALKKVDMIIPSSITPKVISFQKIMEKTEKKIKNYFNPPYSMILSKPVAKECLQLVDKSF